jgi:acyl carrier protein
MDVKYKKKNIMEKKQNKEQQLMDFSKERFLSLLRRRLHLEDDLVSDQELLTMDISKLSVDSIDYAEILVEVETEISKNIPWEDADQFKCFQDVWDYVCKLRECFQCSQ